MTPKCITRPAAQTEIDDQAEYLAEHASESVAYRFLAAVQETIGALLNMPGMGAPWISDHPRLQGIRRHPIKGFPNHLVFYRATDELLEVLHVYHGAEDIENRLAESEDSGP